MGFVGKIAKTTENPAIKYKSLKHSCLYLVFHRFSILFIDLITIHEVLLQDVSGAELSRFRNETGPGAVTLRTDSCQRISCDRSLVLLH